MISARSNARQPARQCVCPTLKMSVILGHRSDEPALLEERGHCWLPCVRSPGPFPVGPTWPQRRNADCDVHHPRESNLQSIPNAVLTALLCRFAPRDDETTFEAELLRGNKAALVPR